MRSVWFCDRCGRAGRLEHLDRDEATLVKRLAVQQHEERQQAHHSRHDCPTDPRVIRIAVGSTDITALRLAGEE